VSANGVKVRGGNWDGSSVVFGVLLKVSENFSSAYSLYMLTLTSH
jgi:hypothetical protein